MAPLEIILGVFFNFALNNCLLGLLKVLFVHIDDYALDNTYTDYSYLSNNSSATISFFGFLQPSMRVFAGGTFSFFSDLQPATIIWVGALLDYNVPGCSMAAHFHTEGRYLIILLFKEVSFL